jgi:CubicO group peptidase (beta-lactamase class C family)
MIRTMTTADRASLPNVETVTNYPGHEAGRVGHASDCPHHAKNDLSGAASSECPRGRTVEGVEFCYCHVFGPLYMETTHVGRVLALRERNGYDDSDFYAIVWDDEKGRPVEVEYASTRGWTYPNGAKVDATPEIVEKWEAWTREQKAACERARLAAEAALPRVGRTVRVVKGRKVEVGTVGEVFWAGRDQFKRGPWGRREIERVGIRLLDGSRVFLDAGNVVVEGAEGPAPADEDRHAVALAYGHGATLWAAV